MWRIHAACRASTETIVRRRGQRLLAQARALAVVRRDARVLEHERGGRERVRVLRRALEVERRLGAPRAPERLPQELDVRELVVADRRARTRAARRVERALVDRVDVELRLEVLEQSARS